MIMMMDNIFFWLGLFLFLACIALYDRITGWSTREYKELTASLLRKAPSGFRKKESDSGN